MTKTYPKGPLKEPYDGSVFMTMISIAEFKSIAERLGDQIEITIKPEGIRTNIVRKTKSGTIKKQQFELDNKDLAMYRSKFMDTINSLHTISYLTGEA